MIRDIKQISAVVSQSHRLPAYQKVGYALGIHGIMYFWFTANLYLFYFYTDVVGLTPTQTGTIFLIALVWDGITDLIMGLITDRWIARGGRYRPLMLIGGIPFCFSFVALFHIPAGVDPFLYGLLANLVFRLFWTMTYIPYTSMLTRITPHSPERASIGGYKTVLTALAKLPVSFFTLSLIAYFGAGNEEIGFLYTMSLIAALAGIAFTLCYLLTPETSAPGNSLLRTERLTAKRLFEYFRVNDQFWIVLISVFLFSGTYGLMLQSIVYFFKYNLGDTGAAKIAFTAVAAAGLLAVPIWMRIARMTSTRFVWSAGGWLAAASLITLYLIPTPGLTVLAVLFFLASCGINAFLMCFLPMTADTVDYGQWRCGYRVEALSFGFLSLANKLSTGAGAWVMGMLQSWVGFVPNTDQSEATLTGLKAIMTLAPSVGFIISALVILRYRIDPEYHRMILEDSAAAAKP